MGWSAWKKIFMGHQNEFMTHAWRTHYLHTQQRYIVNAQTALYQHIIEIDRRSDLLTVLNILLEFIQYIICLINLNFIYLHIFFEPDEFVCWWIGITEKWGKLSENLEHLVNGENTGWIDRREPWVGIFGSTRHFRRILFSKVDQRVGGVKLISENSCSNFDWEKLLLSDFGGCATFLTLSASARASLYAWTTVWVSSNLCESLIRISSITTVVAAMFSTWAIEYTVFCFRGSWPMKLVGE